MVVEFGEGKIKESEIFYDLTRDEARKLCGFHAIVGKAGIEKFHKYIRKIAYNTILILSI